ncbi:hypothetical protein Sjap_004864 [Stephania japonica]|uniref:Uncharacterized protein n=1 Tax=Stephania japonica TaxID=461633 RepID=A0AAP0K2Y2_9MAGN
MGSSPICMVWDMYFGYLKPGAELGRNSKLRDQAGELCSPTSNSNNPLNKSSPKTRKHNNSLYLIAEREPQRRKEKVYIGCGAGFGGDRPMAALKLLQRVPHLDYLVLECLAERTLADRYQQMLAGGVGYDPRIADWMVPLLPLAVEKGTRIITNMGARFPRFPSKEIDLRTLVIEVLKCFNVDPLGAQKEVLNIAETLGIGVTVAVALEVGQTKSGLMQRNERFNTTGGVSTYLGAAPIVQCLDKYEPDVIITSRVADAALFLAPMVYELGWNWNALEQLAQGSLAGHLLECGCQLTGGYYSHPGDKFRWMSFQQLLDLSLPYAEVGFDGKVYVAKVDCSGGRLDFSTCAEQLLYEVGDPGAYVTPDVVIDFTDVSFYSLSSDKVSCAGAKPSDQHVPDKLLQLVPMSTGWKSWGEISYGGFGCVQRAKAAEFLVRSWMEEVYPGVNDCIVSYIIGLDSLKITDVDKEASLETGIEDIRLRMDGLFMLKEHAEHFIKEFMALYTNGPAGGGGISTGHKKEIVLHKVMVERSDVFWRTAAARNKFAETQSLISNLRKDHLPLASLGSLPQQIIQNCGKGLSMEMPSPDINIGPAPSGRNISLYDVAHCRAGDKGNDLNFSVIPHFASDIERLKVIITTEWVKRTVSALLDASSFPEPEAILKRNNWVNENVKVEIYEAKGIHSLNVVVRNILDGGVNCSRRIDRHGKSISDLILRQLVQLPSDLSMPSG